MGVTSSWGWGVDDAGVYTLALQSDDSILDVDRVTVRWQLCQTLREWHMGWSAI